MGTTSITKTSGLWCGLAVDNVQLKEKDNFYTRHDGLELNANAVDYIDTISPNGEAVTKAVPRHQKSHLTVEQHHASIILPSGCEIIMLEEQGNFPLSPRAAG